MTTELLSLGYWCLIWKVLGRVQKTGGWVQVSKVNRKVVPGKASPGIVFPSWRTHSSSVLWISRGSRNAMREYEVGNKVLPSLEEAGNNIFQYFLVSANANARLSKKCTLGEVLEYLQLQWTVILSSSKRLLVKIYHFSLASRWSGTSLQKEICWKNLWFELTLSGPCTWRWPGWWRPAKLGLRRTWGGTESDTEREKFISCLVFFLQCSWTSVRYYCSQT